MEAEAAATQADESATIAALAAALAKAQGQMESAKKDAENPHFRSRYADLASIWAACRAPLSENGLAVLQRVRTGEDAVTVITMLVHSSGEWVRDTCTFPVMQKTPQAYGSAITYARRYTLAALVGVAPDEDDDGNSSSGHAQQPERQTQQRKQQRPAQQPHAAQPANPPAQQAPKRDADSIRCAEEGHRWTLKGECSECGVKEKPAAKPVTPNQPAHLRSRAIKVWQEAQKAKLDLPAFQSWTEKVLGRKSESASWTEDEIAHLEDALLELKHSGEPGAAG